MLAFRSDPTLFPLLIESLVSNPLWTFVTPLEIQDRTQLVQYDVVTVRILNEDGEQRDVVPLFSRREFAEEFRLGWNPDLADRLQISHYVLGRQALEKLGKRNSNLVVDHGHQGVILQADVWRPAFARYGKGREVALPCAPVHLFQPADADDFPALRDRVTSFLIRIHSIRKAWLMWAPATPESARQLCLITVSMGTYDAGRIRMALPLLAEDLILPPLAYLPVAFGTKEIGRIPPKAPIFYSDDLAHALAAPTRRRVQP